MKIAIEPFVHKNNGNKTVGDGKEAACALIPSMSEVDSVLSNKRKADELSQVAAQQQKLETKKKRIPNKMCSKCKIAVIQNLCNHNEKEEVTRKVQAKENLEKQVKEQVYSLSMKSLLQSRTLWRRTKA